MTLDELCQAALQVSDNTAGNLLLQAIGGPPAITEFARSIDDRRELRLQRKYRRREPRRRDAGEQQLRGRGQRPGAARLQAG